MMIKEYLVKKALEGVLITAKKALHETGARLLSTKNDIEEAVAHHLKGITTWAGEVTFNDLKDVKRTLDIFIELDTYVYPRRNRISEEESIPQVNFIDIFKQSERHHIVLGQPGAGKTTSLKYLCNKIFLDESESFDRFVFPLLIKLRDINQQRRVDDGSVIIETLYNILGLRLTFDDKDIKEVEKRWAKERLVVNILDSASALIILDGFDEIVGKKLREDVISDIRTLCEKLHIATLVVTSRTADFNYSINGACQYEICPLNEHQIYDFAHKWLIDDTKATVFLEKVKASPFADTSIRPLTLAHLCAIYERIGNIPEKPKTVYKKIINLLLEEWDQQRSVRRESKYASFEVDRKFEFLANVAYLLTINQRTTVFSKTQLHNVYKKIYEDFGLRTDEGRAVVTEIESHTGLILQAGYEHYEFAHKSLQEYLAAEYLVKLPRIPMVRGILNKLPNELAIAVAISSSPSRYFVDLVCNGLFNQHLSEDYLKAFINRLILEKPDFNSTDELAFGLIMLYTAYVESNIVTNSGQISLFNYDNIISEFDKLMTLIIKKTSIKNVLTDYEKDYTLRLQSDGDIVCFNRRASAVRKELSFRMPNKLFMRSSLLEIASAKYLEHDSEKPSII